MFYVIGNVYEIDGDSLNLFLLELAIALNKFDETGIVTALKEGDAEWNDKLEQSVYAAYHTVTKQSGSHLAGKKMSQSAMRTLN